MTAASDATIRWFAVSALLMACAPKPRVVPSDLSPLDPTNAATLPTAVAGDMHPETIDIVNGHDTKSGYDWADGQGYVHASITQVWSALQDDNVIANRRELKSWSVGKTDVDPADDVSFLLDCVTASASLPFQIEWREAVLSGTLADPKEVIARGDLAQAATVFGSPVMTTLSDSIVLTPIDSETTAYSAIRHRGPDPGSSPDACTQYLNDVYNSVVASVHGKPLPTY